MSTTMTAIPAGRTTTSGAPGSQLPFSSMSVAKSAVLALGVSAAAYASLRLLFQEGGEVPVVKIDVRGAAAIYLGYQIINIPVKLIAFHFHGHPWSQSILTFS